MLNLNNVNFGGNLTRDPELIYTTAGTPITKISVAANRKWKDKSSGEMKEEATFMRITIFGKQAEAVAEHLQKGANVLVEGRLQNNNWETESGEKRSSVDIVADRVHFLGKKGEE